MTATQLELTPRRPVPTQEEAEKHAATLRSYLANPPKRTRKTSEEAVSERSEALEKAVWNL